MAEQKTEGGYILLVEDDRGVIELEAQRLEGLGLELRRAHTAAEARGELLGETAPRITLLDYSLPDSDALALVDEIKKARGEMPPFLLVTGRGDEAVAVAAMKSGACDYVVKDGSFLERLPAVVLKCLNDSALKARVAASEERFRQVFEAANVAKSITLPDGTVTPNQAFCEMLGYTREELAKKNWRELTPPEEVPATEKLVAELARGEKESARFEKRYLRKDGGVVWGDVAVKAKRGASGLLEYFITTIVEVTERRRLEDDLRRHEHRFRELYESIPSSVAVYAPAGSDFTISGVNRSLEKAEQVRREDIVGRLLTEVFPGVEAFGLLEVLRRVSATGAPERFPAKKYEDQRISGWRDNYVYRLREGEVVAVYTDITAEMQARESLQLQEERYRGLVESLPDVVMSFDREHRHLYVSPNISNFGIAASDLIGKSHREAGFPEEQCRVFEENIDLVFKTGRQNEIEFKADLPSGKKAFNWRLIPLVEAAGGVKSVTTYARDITQLRQLQADYKVLFESMLDGFAVHEMIFDSAGRPADYRFLTLNPAFASLTGMGVLETTGRLISELMPDGCQEWVEIYGKVVLTGEPVRFEKFSKDLNKHFNILAFRNSPGQFCTLFTDITVRKEAEETLLRQTVLLELAGRAARFGGWDVDLATSVVHWSDEVARIHEEAPGFCPKVEKGISYYAPEGRAKITEVFSACAAEGVPYDEELEIITAKGNRRWVRTIGQASRDKDGKITGVNGSFQDISDKKKAEAALREEESRLKLLTESAPDGIFVQSGGKFSYLNAAACRLFGAAAPAELLGRPFIDRVAPQFHEAIKRRIAAQRKTGVAAPLMEQEYLRLDGSRVSVETTAVPVKYLGTDSHLVFVRDITARKRMEEEVLKTQKIESLGVLAGGIAHDFNNMLMGVTANLSLLAAKNPAGAEILDDAISAARSAQSLSAQLLSFARGGQPVKKELCLERPLREIYGLSISGSRIEQQLQVPGGLWSVDADENQVKQVVNNILLNALQAMPSGGTLGLKAENLETGPHTPLPLAPGKYLKITVTDTGIGIPEKYLQQLFDPYFTTKPKGHGLGLAMAWTVVKNHGGHILVRSEQGRGSTFEIFLPASGRCLGDCANKPRETPKGSGRILLLEDEEIVSKAAGRMLRELGYSHETTADGRETLRRYEEAQKEGRPFDAVIMDLTIPGGMGGGEAGPELRRRFPEAVVIVSSGYSDEAVMADYKAYGFSAVLPKPYDYEKLGETLDRLLKRGRGD